MDFSSTLKRSFKSQGRNLSASGPNDDDFSLEQLPILSDHRHHSPTNHRHDSPTSDDDHPHPQLIVKIDSAADPNTDPNNNNNKPTPDEQSPTHIWRQSSYEFWTAPTTRGLPPVAVSRSSNSNSNSNTPNNNLQDLEMINSFHNHHHHRQQNLPSEIETNHENNRTSSSLSKDLKVSFHTPSSVNSSTTTSDDDEDRRSDGEIVSSSGHCHSRKLPSNASTSANINNNNNMNSSTTTDEVLKCTSFQRRPSIIFPNKTQSRLSDPPPPDQRSEKMVMSGQLKSSRTSGMLEKVPTVDDDDDDETFIDDVPADFKRAKLDALTLLQWISLILIVTALICTLVISKWKTIKLRGLKLWKWEVLVLVLICGRLVSGWWIRIAVFFIERNFLLRKRVLYFVYGLRKAVQNCIWLGLVLIAWQYLFDKNVEGDNRFLWFVNKFMWCMLTATLLWLLKTLAVKVLASSFHVSTFFDRIQDSLFNQYVIEVLSGPPLMEIQSNQEEEERTMIEISKLQNAGATLPPELRATAFPSPAKSGRGLQNAGRALSIKFSGLLPSNSKKQDDTITIDHLHKLNPKNISAWNMKRLMNIVRHVSLSTLDEQIHDMTTEDSSKQIKSEYEAKLAARKIFRNVARPRAKHIYMRDLLRFLREDEAGKAMAILEGSTEKDKISKKDLKVWVVNAFRERRALALTLNDTKTAVNKLHQMVNVLVGIIIAIICVVILGLASTQFLLAVSSQIVVVTFIFGNTCKTVFESIIFLFVIHPFDVGDRCEIDGVQMVVEEMNIMTTVFLRFDNQKIVYPNSTLSTVPIHNYYRSPDMDDAIDFWMHIATPTEKINLFTQRIVSYIDNKKDHWYPSPVFVTRDMEDLNKIKMSLWPTHKMNHQNMIERYKRRGLLVEEIITIAKELDIEYRLYPLNINIQSIPNSTRMPSTWNNTSAG